MKRRAAFIHCGQYQQVQLVQMIYAQEAVHRDLLHNFMFASHTIIQVLEALIVCPAMMQIFSSIHWCKGSRGRLSLYGLEQFSPKFHLFPYVSAHFW